MSTPMRKPGKAAQESLAKLLKDVGVSCEAFERLLAPGLSLPRSGRSIDELLECVEYLANRGQLTGEIIDVLEASFPGRGDDFARVRVDMEFVAPSSPLLPSAELDGIKRSARKGGLHAGLAHSRFAARLNSALRRSASTSLELAEQMDAWFDAANRQPLEPGDKAWMLGLLAIAVELANDPGKTELRVALNRLRLVEPTDLRDVALTDGDKGALEALAKAYGIMLSAGAFVDRLTNGLERTCLAQIAGSDAGTGFLVGDDLVLTAHHVLSDVLGGNFDASLVEFQFDFREKDGAISKGPKTGLSFEGKSDASPMPWLIDASLPSDAEQEKPPKVDITKETDADRLDFVLVRIADPLGAQ